MQEVEDKRTIQQRMIAVMAEVGHIGKDRQAPSVVGGYKFRGIDDFLKALQPALIKHGVVIIPQVLDISREERTTKSGGVSINTILKIAYEFHGACGDHVKAVVVGEGADSTDKGCNKAMSTGFKYLACQSFCIPTDEPDADTENSENPGFMAGDKKANGKKDAPKSQGDGRSTQNSASPNAKAAAQQGQSQTAPANSTPAPAGNGKENTQQATTTNAESNGSSTAQSAGASSANANQADPKSIGGQSSGAGSGTTTSAGVEIASKVQLQQLLQAAVANGWQGKAVSDWICHQFKLTVHTIEKEFTVKQWEAAVKILSNPGNKGGKVQVDHRGQPLPAEHHWPKA